MNWFKKKTREQQIEKRAENVFTELTGLIDCKFTELETIQILNNVRRKLSENLTNKKAVLMEQNVANSQKINEIINALEYIE